ncbi:hypothetical protein LH464_17475, partial [Neorhizobium sp. T786]|nr:hypothetical protein [Neorhizobium xiangyangii]
MANTEHLGLAKPDPEADVDDEFYRLQQVLDQLDAIIHALRQSVAGKAAADHTHPIQQVENLAAALAEKMNADKTFSLDDLTDVSGAADAALGYILARSLQGWVPMSAAAAIGVHRHGVNDIDGLAQQIETVVANLGDGAPAALDTLRELAAALNNDPNFATSIISALSMKVSKTGDTITGALKISS